MSERLFEVDGWRIVENSLHRDEMRLSESIMSTGNGYMGMRGNFEESYSGDTHRGTYIAGVWFPDKTRVGWWKIGYPEYFGKVINSTNFIGIDLKINGHRVDLAVDEVVEFRRELDMKSGVLYRRFIVNTPAGKVEVKAERFLSIGQRELAAIRYRVCPLENEAEIELLPYLDGDVCNEDSNYKEKFWEGLSGTSKGLEASLVMQTKANPFNVQRFTACTAMKVLTFGNKIEENNASDYKNSYVGTKISFRAGKAEWVGIDKFVALTTTRDMEEAELAARAGAITAYAIGVGYERIKAVHVEGWKERWDKADIEIKGDPEAQQGIRFNIFQLLSTYYGEDSRLNIGPKGFTGEKYGGATYWDTEAYAFPMYLAIASTSVARNLLIYRHNQLAGAYENARRQGLPGALYPMVTFTGVECHNEWEITFEEIHRNAAIAFAVYQYVNYTGDKEYLRDYGVEVLVGIARFWAGRVHYSRNADKYMIHGVTGPNEYENNVNNNWYTNRMAMWCLEYALEAIDFAGASETALKLKVAEDEKAKWRDIISNMYLPYSEEHGVFLQHDTFLDKDLKKADEIPAYERPINQHWSWDRILRSCYIKQADVLQGLYFLGNNYSEEVKRRNFMFYEPMTVHESSLSPCVHAILAAELGIEKKAVEMYKRTARLDLDNYNNDSGDGLHITSMSGSWLAIVQGFAGMRTANGRLSFKPFLPEGWESYSFKVNYRERLLRISVSKEKTTVELESGEQISILLHGREVDIKCSPKAVIFDLDGVVVDTAKYHYMAWKRLAKQYGYDFTEEDNEQFKGVNRIRCMELLAEMVGLKLSSDEMTGLADMKNSWYVEYISNMNSEEILPGFMDFVTEIHRKGYKTALASASKNAAIVLDRIGIRQCFDTVVDGNDVKRSKPDPQVFELAAERLGLKAEYCMVFEDAQAGIVAAKAAGMYCVGIGRPDALTGADIVVAGFEDCNLGPFIERQGR